METIYSFEYDIGKKVIVYRTILYSMSPKHTKTIKNLTQSKYPLRVVLTESIGVPSAFIGQDCKISSLIVLA